MNAFLLEQLDTLRNHLAKDFHVYEPRGAEGHWLEVGDAAPEPFEGGGAPPVSAKPFFFAEREPLFGFDGERFKEQLPIIEPRVLFGVRSCDLCAIAYQDRFFREDPYYRARRHATLLVGIDCTEPCDGGFCREVDSGPFVRDATADLICRPLPDAQGGGFLLFAASEAGERVSQGLDLELAPEGWECERRDAEKGVAEQFPGHGYIQAGIGRINRGEVTAAEWEAMGLQCTACSGCTSLCPTCSCYATFDTPSDDGFVRERCWDSCLYVGFQREAAGYNPSATAGSRVERFWFHKFSDEYLPEFGRYGCVGCGRCEQTCTGVIGVHTVMRRLAESP